MAYRQVMGLFFKNSSLWEFMVTVAIGNAPFSSIETNSYLGSNTESQFKLFVENRHGVGHNIITGNTDQTIGKRTFYQFKSEFLKPS